jgi:hypothetical protein
MQHLPYRYGSGTLNALVITHRKPPLGLCGEIAEPTGYLRCYRDSMPGPSSDNAAVVDRSYTIVWETTDKVHVTLADLQVYSWGGRCKASGS